MNLKNRAQLLYPTHPSAYFVLLHIYSILLPYFRKLGQIFPKYFFVSAELPWKNKFVISVSHEGKIEKSKTLKKICTLMSSITYKKSRIEILHNPLRTSGACKPHLSQT